MPLILDTYDTNTWISHISEDARKYLIIICPYLKINEKLRRTMEVADSRGVNLFVLYGKRELDNETMAWLKKLSHSNIAFIKNLHAKLYMNDDFAVISSMNLYEYSQVNNEELGVLFGKREDRSGFKEIIFQVMRLIDISEKEHGGWDVEDIGRPTRGLFKRSKGKEDQRVSVFETEVDGDKFQLDTNEMVGEQNSAPEVILCHCIRCGRTIPSTHDYVYCGRCMDSWQRYSNTRYVEPNGHCYICGGEYEASAEKPACIKCYRSHKEIIDDKCRIMWTIGK